MDPIINRLIAERQSWLVQLAHLKTQLPSAEWAKHFEDLRPHMSEFELQWLEQFNDRSIFGE